ncbi:MAG: glycosyltransferase family 4 protein [Desulfobacterales bacterium]
MNTRDERPSILVLSSTYPRWQGDAEPPFVHELSRRLANQFDVHVLAPHAPGSRTRETLDGVFVHRFRYAPGRFESLAYQGGILANLKKSPLMVGLVPFFFIAQLLATVQLLVKLHIDIVHAHWIFPQGLTALLARTLSGRRVRVLCTSHGGDLYGLRGSIFLFIKKWVAARCDHLTVVSRSMREDLLQLGAVKNKISVIPMGVDLQHRFVPPKKPAPLSSLLFVGRLVEKKGLRYLLAAMPEITERFPDSHLTVVGDGPDRTNLEKLYHNLGIQGRVKFLGSLPNEELPFLYQQAGIVVFPSVVSGDGDREGFGLVLVEAMGCGCAAVVTDLPAMRDIVDQGKSGFIVAQRDAKAIAGAVLRLQRDQDLADALAGEGRRKTLDRFDWELVSSRYSTLLKSMAADRQSSLSFRQLS